ncbi:hypothetical protein T484DRAFT_1879097 [Baffinella frigidus]|nr:hypothetical protein T484DRAFT_1879097 [Cryptophyta sp. CCMP2293]
MARWDAALLLALLMFGHLCNASQPDGEGDGEGQRNLYDQVYAANELYRYSDNTQGNRNQRLMANVLQSPALWGDRESAEPLSVLDAGAGQGAMVDWLRRVPSPGSVDPFGVELSGVAVDSSPWPELKRNGTLVRGSLDAIPWPDRRFDLVWSTEVLEHIPAAQMPAVAREIARVSRDAVVLTISLRLSIHDDPVRPHLHITCRPRAWWDAVWADAGCYPHLDLIGELWRGASRGYEPFEEPYVFAYSCGHAPEEARASLASMRHLTEHGQRAGSAHGWGGFYFGTHEYSHWTEDCGSVEHK